MVHGHERVWKRYRKGVYVVRDGRDALVSQYFFMTRHLPEGDHPRLTAGHFRVVRLMSLMICSDDEGRPAGL